MVEEGLFERFPASRNLRGAQLAGLPPGQMAVRPVR
jgi:hypothetical protein